MKYTIKLIDTNYYKFDVNAETRDKARDKAWSKFFALSQREKDELCYDADGDTEIICEYEVDE